LTYSYIRKRQEGWVRRLAAVLRRDKSWGFGAAHTSKPTEKFDNGVASGLHHVQVGIMGRYEDSAARPATTTAKLPFPSS
jgi:hypothetical protein